MAVGVFALAFTIGMTVWDCRSYDGNRTALLAFLEIVCPAGRLDSGSGIPLWHALFSRLSLLGMLGCASLAAGIYVTWRDRHSNVTLDVLLELRPLAVSERGRDAGQTTGIEFRDTSTLKGFGRKKARPPSEFEPLDASQAAQAQSEREKRALILEQEGRRMSAELLANMSPDERAKVLAAQEKENERRLVEKSVADRIARGELAAAVAIIESAIAEFGDSALSNAVVASRSADLDWIGICAEAIEADVRLKSLGETGCRQLRLQIGNVPENCRSLKRYYYGPAPEGAQVELGWPAGRLGGYHGLVEQFMWVDRLEDVAQIQLSRESSSQPWGGQRQATRIMLAGHLRMLRFFEAVQRHAGNEGLPFPVRLEVGAERIGGEDAIRQLRPAIDMVLKCSIRTPADQVFNRLEHRHAGHVDKWHADTNRLLETLEMQFHESGYVPSRLLPDEMADVKRHLWDLEQNFLVHRPEHRISRRQFKVLLGRVETLRDQNAPMPIVRGNYSPHP